MVPKVSASPVLSWNCGSIPFVAAKVKITSTSIEYGGRRLHCRKMNLEQKVKSYAGLERVFVEEASRRAFLPYLDFICADMMYI